MTSEEARSAAVAAASTMTNVEAYTNDFAQPMTAKPLGTFRGRNSAHGEAWLTVFRLFKHRSTSPNRCQTPFLCCDDFSTETDQHG